MKQSPLCGAILLTVLSTAHAQSYSRQFSESDEEGKMVLCTPVLKKAQEVLVKNLIASKRRGEKVDEGIKVVISVGYRAEALSVRSERLNPSLLKQAWSDSAELDLLTRNTKSTWTGTCIDLYNKFRKADKIDFATESRAIGKVTSEIKTRLASMP